jgi:hypothetical protein
MPRTKPVQTRLPHDLARDLASVAAAEGLDTSNWIRRLITMELRPRALVDAWMRSKGSFPPELGLRMSSEEKPDFYLLPARTVAVTDGLDREFIIYVERDRPLTAHALRQDAARWRALDTGTNYVVLRGSASPWKSLGQLESFGRNYLTLRPVRM